MLNAFDVSLNNDSGSENFTSSVSAVRRTVIKSSNSKHKNTKEEEKGGMNRDIDDSIESVLKEFELDGGEEGDM